MNNLKFRAWDKTKEVFTNYQIVDDMLYFMDKFTGVWKRDDNQDRFVLMQSTGYKDKKGIEIFIGDIVKFPDLYGFYDFEGGLTSVDGLNVAIVVKKGNSITLDNFAGGDGFTERELENYECTFDDLDFENFEIIGNIYENKELIENEI
jgi:hypothetical protein